MEQNDEGPNTVALIDAQRWALTWRQQQGTYNAHHELHAFHIPLDDLQKIINTNPDAVRAYLGVNADGAAPEEKLLIVGTKYNEKTEEYEDMIEGGPVEGSIYDFTRPCPQFCSSGSLLHMIPIND